jgi:multimeric flavodoxin WrbA
MKITAFNSSPWAHEGHTQIIVDEFLLGAANAGAKNQSVQLVEKQIKPCTRCGACFYKTPGRCSVRDDMAGLIEKFMASDIVVLATPVYIDNVTSLMKLFIDRLTPVLEPHFEKDKNGEYRRRGRFGKYPKFVVISTCAMPEMSHFQVVQLFFERMARTIHTEVVGEIYRDSAGLLLLCTEQVSFRPVVDEYRKLLRSAGTQLVQTGYIPNEISRKLYEPMIDAEEYIEYANKTWDRILPKQKMKIFA